MRDSFVFYRSFYEAAQDLNSRERLKLFDAVCAYALNDEIPELTGAASGMFKLLKPQVDANNRRFENGRKGGRPKQNQTKTKTEPKQNQKETENEPTSNPMKHDNVNDNENVNVNDNDNDNGAGCGGGSDNDKYNIFKILGADGIDAIYEVYPESGGFLLEKVAADVKLKRKVVKHPVEYVLGYASNVEWDDSANHFEEVRA